MDTEERSPMDFVEDGTFDKGTRERLSIAAEETFECLLKNTDTFQEALAVWTILYGVLMSEVAPPPDVVEEVGQMTLGNIANLTEILVGNSHHNVH